MMTTSGAAHDAVWTVVVLDAHAPGSLRHAFNADTGQEAGAHTMVLTPRAAAALRDDATISGLPLSCVLSDAVEEWAWRGGDAEWPEPRTLDLHAAGWGDLTLSARAAAELAAATAPGWSVTSVVAGIVEEWAVRYWAEEA